MKCMNCRFAQETDFGDYYICNLFSHEAIMKDVLVVPRDRDEDIRETDIIVHGNFGCVRYRERIKSTL